MPTFPVLILDPGNFTPYYDANLCQALAGLGAKVEWVTSPYLFEPVVPDPCVCERHIFFTLFDHPLLRPLTNRVRSVPRLRRLLKALSYPFEMLNLTRELGRRSPGIVHVQWSLIPWFDALLYRQWRQRGWRVVFTAHDIMPRNPQGWRVLLLGWERAQRRWLYASTDAIIVHSAANRESVVALGAATERVYQVSMGDLGSFSGPPLPQKEARAQLGLDPDKPVALFFGLIKPYKGLGALLRSLPMVRERVPDMHLLVAGEPMEPLAPYQRLIADLGLGAHVAMHTRYIPSELVPTYFCAADLVVLPYLDISLSAVLVTAYGYARPVVVTAVGGLPELVENGITGLVVRPGDEAALADGVATLLSDPARCHKMGERARQLAEERHSWPAIGRKTLALYEDIWNGHRGSDEER
ncbi:MAG: glycosyltransferase family 4 protein [Anaerolineae bacterium]|nr:glycosyltransferase family 4 protein [Anaerolineae bacterium]